jgi:hypothetical protein
MAPPPSNNHLGSLNPLIAFAVPPQHFGEASDLGAPPL